MAFKAKIARFLGEEVHSVDAVLIRSENKLWRKLYIKDVVWDCGSEILVKSISNKGEKINTHNKRISA